MCLALIVSVCLDQGRLLTVDAAKEVPLKLNGMRLKLLSKYYMSVLFFNSD